MEEGILQGQEWTVHKETIVPKDTLGQFYTVSKTSREAASPERQLPTQAGLGPRD